MAIVATLSKGYDLDYIWKQVDRGPAKDAARNDAAATSVLIRSLWKSNITNPAKITRPSTE